MRKITRPATARVAARQRTAIELSLAYTGDQVSPKTRKSPPKSQLIDPPSIRGTGSAIIIGRLRWPIGGLDARISYAKGRGGRAVWVLVGDVVHYLMESRGKVVEVRLPAEVAAQAIAKHFTRARS